MPIRIACPGCGKTIKAADEWAGKQAKCPACGNAFVVPQMKSVAAPPPPLPPLPPPSQLPPLPPTDEFFDGILTEVKVKPSFESRSTPDPKGPLISANGIGGLVEVYPHQICIKRSGVSGFILHGFKGDKSIRMDSISSVQLKRAGYLFNGYIQFAFTGGSEAKGGLFQAVDDENTVMFQISEQAAFERVKQHIEDRLTAPKTSAQPAASGADELAKFALLRDQGILTEEEFQAKKRQILGF